MKKNKKYIYLSIISIIVAVITVIMNISTQFTNGVGMDRTPFDYAWFDVYIYTGFNFLILGPIFLILSCKNIHDVFHSGAIKNMIQREKFKNIKRKYLINAWKSTLFLYPIFLVLTYILCYFIFPTKGVGINLVNNGPMISSAIILIRYCLTTILYSIFVLNITLIVSKKVANFSIVTILSYIIVMIYAVVSQLFLLNFFKMFLLNEQAKGLDLINGLVFGYGNIITILLHAVILIVSTTLILVKIYKNQNEVILDYEEEN